MIQKKPRSSDRDFLFALASFLGRPSIVLPSATVQWTVAGIRISYIKSKTSVISNGGLCSHYLSSQAVARQVLSAYMSLTSVFGMGREGSAALRRTKRPERVAAVGERRSRLRQGAHRAPQQETGGPSKISTKEKPLLFLAEVYVGITYLPRQSPAKYCQRR